MTALGTCRFVPPYLLRQIAAAQGEVADHCHATLAIDERMRTARLAPPAAPRAMVTPAGPAWTVHTADPPGWARAAGYGWLVIDMTTDIMALNGVPPTIYLAMRYGGHISAALWIATASWQAKGAVRIVGLLLALILGGYSFIAPLPGVPMYVLYPTLVLIPLWLVLVGRLFVRGAGDQHEQAEVAREQTTA